MNKNRIMGLALGVLLLSATGAMAQDLPSPADLITPNLPSAQEGELYDRNDVLDVSKRVNLPVAREPESLQANHSTEQPVVVLSPGKYGSESLQFAGSAIVTPRGGAISTPKQQADRQIKRLIRRLD